MARNFPSTADDRCVDRRRPRPPDQPAIDELQRMPALVMLERLPTPALALDRAGTILFANGAFCDMVGYPPEELLWTNFSETFDCQPAGGPITVSLNGVDRLTELRHKDGHVVKATMSRSAMRRRDDPFALATFEDRTEELWLRSADEEWL